MEFVDGISSDYVFGTEDSTGRKKIEDYGDISNEGIIEILCKIWEPKDEWDALLKKRIIELLAERLKVKLRKKPLSSDQMFNRIMKRCNKIDLKEEIKAGRKAAEYARDERERKKAK